MSEHDAGFDRLMADAMEGRLSRRQVLKRGAALGLSAPAIAAVLAACGGGGAETPAGGTGAGTPAGGTPGVSPETGGPTGERGGGGELNLLYWQAPTILNCHLSSGTKDFNAARVVLEPLLEFNADNEVVPVLAAEVPSVENGLLAEDGTSVTWKLRQGVKWHDGEDFTADDVRFTYEWVTDPAVAATTLGSYTLIESVEVIDEYTIKLNFTGTNPDWFTPFSSGEGVILPEHIMRDFKGENARNAEFNLKPIGTGPYKVVDFRPGDVVVYEINADYWDPGKPHFDRITMKGGGDATSAARAVLQSGEADYAWNIQVEDAILTQLEQAGQGSVLTWPGGGTEKMLMNFSDPLTERDGERSHKDVPHPHFSERNIRKALDLATDRGSIAAQLYGRGGQPATFTQNKVTTFHPADISWTYDLDQAAALLDEVGATPGPDGIRVFNGRPLNWVYQTSVNSIRQKHQEIVKNALSQIGVGIEIKSIDAGVFFSGDPGSDDTLNKFYADIEMYTNSPSSPFPIRWFRRYLSSAISQKENQWAEDNSARYQNPEFDRLYDEVKVEIDQDRANALFTQITRLIWDDVAELGAIARQNVSCVSNKLKGQQPTQWTYDTYDIKNWYLES